VIRLDENEVAGVSPRRQRPATQQKLEQVMTKAAGLIADRGFAGVSMRSVSRSVNVSLASLYHYFKSKEDLLYQIQFRTFASLLRAQEETAACPGSPEARFRRLVIGHLAFFASHPNELKVCTYELDSLRGEMFDATEALRRRYYRLMASVVSELMNGSIPESGESLESRHATLFVFGMLNWVFMWYDPARHGSLEQIGEEMLALILNGLKRAEPQP
jgi:TetR/AcrR family transcriptional regulator, cholesterol catabolism regulator